jgi:hypothetical protein
MLSSSIPHQIHNRNRFHAHRRHTRQQVDHLFLVVDEAVGVELFADGRVFGFLFFVLVENPFQG